ncbi:MAG: type II secretion system F family protein [Gammaproteobacteria bacterium]
MPQFIYKGRDRAGGAIEGEVEATSADAVALQLQSKGITPIDINEHQPSINPLAQLASRYQESRPVKLEDIILFSRQMYTLLRAGVPIIRAINGLSETTRNFQFKTALKQIANDLESGYELSRALNQHPHVFSSLFVSMVQVGENTGNMDDAFLQLSDYLERERETRAQVKSAMRYPLFVIGAISVAMLIINIWVIPTFTKVFAGFGAELPLPTRMLIGLSDFFVAAWPFLLLGLMVSIFVGKKYLRTESGRYHWDRLKLKQPVVGSILQRALLARFGRAFSMALRAGVPLVQGLNLVAKAVDNTFVGKNINDMRIGVERGDTLTHTAAATQMFTPLVIQMLAVGEESGAVDDLLEQVADFYDREVDYDLKSLSSKLEPLLIIVIGIMVLVLALGVFLPMWDLINAAK